LITWFYGRIGCGIAAQRKRLAEVVRTLPSGAFGNRCRGSGLNPVAKSVAEQPQIFKGAVSSFLWNRIVCWRRRAVAVIHRFAQTGHTLASRLLRMDQLQKATAFQPSRLMVAAMSFRRTIQGCLSDSPAAGDLASRGSKPVRSTRSEKDCSYRTNQEEELAMKYALSDVDVRKTERVAKIERLGGIFLRYGLVVAIGWIAAMKVTEYEAKGIQPLIAHSPFLSWGYSVWSVHHFTMIIGAIEVSIATLIALRRWFPTASAVGSVGAVMMFLTTLSFIITTPGWEPSLGGFPALSGDVGEFLIKDLVLLGAALWTLADSLSAVSPQPGFLRNREQSPMRIGVD
jgi:uncharacterized membrane protein YkgB